MVNSDKIYESFKLVGGNTFHVYNRTIFDWCRNLYSERRLPLLQPLGKKLALLRSYFIISHDHSNGYGVEDAP